MNFHAWIGNVSAYSPFRYLWILFVLGLGQILWGTGCESTSSSPTPSSTSPPSQISAPNPDFRLILPAQSQLNVKPENALPSGDPTGILSGGAGVAVADINQDSLPDLLFSGGLLSNKLYLNKGGFVFEDITAQAGIAGGGPDEAHTESVHFVDINGDGWVDIYLVKSGLDASVRTGNPGPYGRNLLYINQGDNTFLEKGTEYNLDMPGLSTTAQFFDYDNDGDLDVYLAQTPEPGAAFNFSYYQKPPVLPLFSDRLMENMDGKRFKDVSRQAGILFKRNLSLSVSLGDINQDGWMDLYVANDFFGPDFLYINQQNKRFKEVRTQYLSQTPMSSMGSDIADVDNDGWPDVFVGEMMPESHERQKKNRVPFSLEIYERLTRNQEAQYTRNMLFANQQGKRLRDMGLLAGVYATEWSWSSFFFDADLDGNQDLFVANGIKRDMTNMDFVKSNFGESYTEMANPAARAKADISQVPSVTTPNYVFQNKGHWQFNKKNTAWGINQSVHTQGATYADLDNDGDLDLILNNMTQSPYLYENQIRQTGENNYLKIYFKGKGKNTQGIGAKATIYTGSQLQMRQLVLQRGYQSNPEPVLHFGLGKASRIDSIRIEWPGGKQEVLKEIAANQSLYIAQKNALSLPKVSPSLPSPLFTEKTDNQRIRFYHQENDFNDFKRERLIPLKHSRPGPPLTTTDVNQDGLTDVFVGGARNQSGKLWLQQASGAFNPAPQQPWQQDAGAEDSEALFFDANGDELPDLYVGSGSGEFAPDDPLLRDRLYINQGQGRFQKDSEAIPSIASATRAVAAGDVDQDGDMDLLVASEISPGDYGRIPSSYLWENQGGTFVDVTTKKAPALTSLGRITDAAWVDINADQQLECVLVGSWMPITILAKQEEIFVPQSLPDFQGSEGWWNTLSVADWDQDGDMDFVVGNHGKNSIFKASSGQPMTLVTHDLDANGTLDPLVFLYTQGVNGPFVNRDLFCSHLPAYNNQFYTFERYAQATFSNLFTPEQMSQAQTQFVYECQSVYVENIGNQSFSIQPLPIEAQHAPVNAILPMDVNGDTHLDILLGGNSNSIHYEYGPIYAMEGLVLLGDGTGQFSALSAAASGLEVPGVVQSMVSLEQAATGQTWVLVGNNQGDLQTFVQLPLDQ